MLVIDPWLIPPSVVAIVCSNVAVALNAVKSVGMLVQTFAEGLVTMGHHSYGLMGVDWEERVRYDRLRDERLSRIKHLLAASELGALLCFVSPLLSIAFIVLVQLNFAIAPKIPILSRI